jgi:plastocyanin
MKSIFKLFPGVAAAAALCLGCPLSGLAASTGVTIGSPLDRFSPAVVTIAAGDQVIWTWAAGNHSTTSGTNGVAGDDNGVPSGLWDSGTILTLPHTFTNTFPVAGNFSYFCKVHFTLGMTGAVVVTNANIPPTVSITNPATGALFVAPASVTIQASATNGSGTVTNVQFRIGSTVLTNDNAAPFAGTTNNLAAGSYTLTAIASDNNGLKATNSVNITVDTPPTVTITNPLDNATLSAPANVTIQASASDPDAGGSVTNVQFLVGSTVLTNETTAPFSAATNNLAAGSYTLTAIASDNLGVKTTNSVNVVVDTPPTVSITNPVSGTVFIAPGNLTIQASASDLDAGGSVTNVQFLVGSTVLTNQTTAPFSGTTNNLAAGSYTLSAVASDNLGVKTTNSVNIVVDTPPAVTITNPLDNATLSAPANVTIQASASDPDAGGSVTNVQFLVGSAVLTNQTTAPFSAATNNLAAGSYRLWAVASDNNGVKNTNAVTINVVTPVQTILSGTAQTFSTNFQFSYSANVGLSYIVQRSTNLTEANWITLVTNVAGSNPVVFVDNHATNGTGFYRVGRLPNP